MQDFCLTAILAIFWLAASAAWANGVINMKYAANPDNWIFDSSDSICQLNNGNYINTNVDKCNVVERGSFQKANISIVSTLIFYLTRLFSTKKITTCSRSLVSLTLSCGVQICGFCTRRRPGSLMDLNNSSSKLNSPPNLHFKCLNLYLFGFAFDFKS